MSDDLDREIAAQRARAFAESLQHVPYVSHLSDAEKDDDDNKFE